MAPDEDDNWDEIDFSGLRLSLNKERGHTTVSPAVALSFDARDRIQDSSRGFIGLSDTPGISDKTAEGHRMDEATIKRRLQPSHLDGLSQAHSTQTLPARPAHLGRTALPRHAVQSAGTDRTGPSPAEILTARAPAARILSRYSESADDAADFDCLDVLDTPKQSQDRAGRVQDRLRMGLQPRRHAPSASDLGRIEAWQATTSIAARGQGLQKAVSTEDDDFDLPADFVLDRHKLVTQKAKARQAPATLVVESDDWDDTTGFTDSRGISVRRHRTRESTGSSSLSLSMTSTVESEDVTDGLELPDTATLDLRQRFRDTRDRRAAGETLRGLSNPHTAHESLLSGLELEPEAFLKAPGIKHVNVRRGIASSPGAGFTQATLRPSGTFRSRPPIPSFRADETMNTQRIRTSHQASPAAASTTTTVHGRQNGHSPSKENGSPSGTLRSTSARTKPAFLPGGASSSADRSYHVNAISTRQTRLEMDTSTVSATQTNYTARGPPTSGTTGTMRSTPSPIKRRATASEALKTELSKRKPALTHVRSKTYGEGNELDGLEDMPTTSAADRGVIRQRDGTRRQPSGPSAGTTTASAAMTSNAPRVRTRAAMSAEQRLQSFREQRDRSAALQPSTGTRLRPAASQPPLRNPQANLDEAPLRRALQDQTGNAKPGSSQSAPAAVSARSPISGGNPFNTRANLQRNGNTAPSSPKPPRLRSESLRASKKRKPGVPFLISNLNSILRPQYVKGMYYNPNTGGWEGNNHEMERFDTVSRTPPRPALISNRVQTASTAISGRVGQVSAIATTDVNGSGSTAQSGAGMKLQVEGDMVFDPDQMCWLKMSAAAMGDAGSARGSVSEEEDPFEGIEDLLVDEVFAGSGADLQATNGTAGHAHTSSLSALHGQGSMHAKSEQHFMVGEEFDVGPGFIKRQRAYEAIWQKTTAGWILPGSQQAMLQPAARETRLWEVFHLVCD